ncbi:MAG TPA: 23S rRNA (adenine(2503)-C(2))-methyltransferase RlmN [Candidatus Hydrogenedentes bacterium]|nr:23S rRNA (adenine(2503)-C(2))-methyltransferase RlmN [Candidatus Hydrogenedentota bacterium]
MNTPNDTKPTLVGLTPTEMASELGLKPFQARQIFRWIHGKQVFDFERMTDLSKALRARLDDGWRAGLLTPCATQECPRSGTKKMLFGLRDGATVEAVLLRHEARVTLCLSTQVGCPLACAFCATGLSGFTRNLDADEIAEQALRLLAGEDLEERTPNLVYMGMGEPLLNYDAVMRSIRLLMAPEGLGVGARKITVSTVGIVPGIRRFAKEDWQVRLSVSLHAANNTLRSRLAPINREYPLAELGHALHEYVAKTGRQFTVEWVLLKEVNDSPKDARELAQWLRAFKAGVNLIPYNGVPEAGFEASPRARCEAFRAALAREGVKATLRQERGQDIDAACGQLRQRTVRS